MYCVCFAWRRKFCAVISSAAGLPVGARCIWFAMLRGAEQQLVCEVQFPLEAGSARQHHVSTSATSAQSGTCASKTKC